MFVSWILGLAACIQEPAAPVPPHVPCDEVDSGALAPLPPPSVPWSEVVHSADDDGLWLAWRDDAGVVHAARATCRGAETVLATRLPPDPDPAAPRRVVSADATAIRLMDVVPEASGWRVDWTLVPTTHPRRAFSRSHDFAGEVTLLAGHHLHGALLLEEHGEGVTVWHLDRDGRDATPLSDHDEAPISALLADDGTAWWVVGDTLVRDGETHSLLPRSSGWTMGSRDDQVWLATFDGNDLVLASSTEQASRTIGLQLATDAVDVVVGPRYGWVLFDGYAPTDRDNVGRPDSRVAPIGSYGQVGLPQVVRRRTDVQALAGIAATRLPDGRLLAVFASGEVTLHDLQL